MEKIILHYSEELVREAVRGYWRRTLGWSYLLALALLAAFCFYCIFTDDWGWVTGAAATVLIMGIAMAIALYFVHYRGAVTRLRRMQLPLATLEMNDETFRLTSDAGSSELSWRVVSMLWRFESFWLFLYSPAQFSILPLADLDEQTQLLIVKRIRKFGGKLD